MNKKYRPHDKTEVGNNLFKCRGINYDTMRNVSIIMKDHEGYLNNSYNKQPRISLLHMKKPLSSACTTGRNVCFWRWPRSISYSSFLLYIGRGIAVSVICHYIFYANIWLVLVVSFELRAFQAFPVEILCPMQLIPSPFLQTSSHSLCFPPLIAISLCPLIRLTLPRCITLPPKSPLL